MSPTMDVEVISELFDMYIKAEEILGINDDLKEKAIKARNKLPPLKVGTDGRLLEWQEEYEEEEKGHRHISHAFGLYPGRTITKKTPSLFNGIKKSIEERLSFGSGRAGWSRSWIINLYARLFDGEKAYESLLSFFRGAIKPNLFNTHPPFQIDGNFGGVAGIVEMLIQSHEEEINLLPSLPKAWKNGRFYGLKARGNIEVSLEWKDCKVTSLRLLSKTDKKVAIKVNGTLLETSLIANQQKIINL